MTQEGDVVVNDPADPSDDPVLDAAFGYPGFESSFDLFQRGKRGDAGWASFQFPSTANPFLDQEELSDIARDMPALVKR